MAITISLRPSPDDADDGMLLFPEREGMVADALTAPGEEGRLAVDVFESDDAIVIRSPIAGVRPEEIDVSLHNDMLTIRGRRDAEDVPGARALVRECHWGAFSRSVILPAETDADRISAAVKDGVLTVRLPKSKRSRRIGVRDLG